MTNVIHLIKRSTVDSYHRFHEFIHLCKNKLTGLVSDDKWSENVWVCTDSVTRVGKPNIESRFHFYQLGTLTGRGNDSDGVPFSVTFSEFPRAYIRYHFSATSKNFKPLNDRLLALVYIHEAFLQLGISPDICQLSVNVCNAAVRISGQSVGDAVSYQRAAQIRAVYKFCHAHGFLATPFTWNHGVPKPLDPSERIGVEFAERRSAKIPSKKSLDVLAHVYCHPRNFRDVLFSSVTAICLCAPVRIHEVLQLCADCGCSESRRNSEGHVVPAYGIRVYSGKGNPPQIKWIPQTMQELAAEALVRLLKVSAQARVISSWYVEHPTEIYLPDEYLYLRGKATISAEEIGILCGIANVSQWANKKELHTVISSEGIQSHTYLFREFEKVILALLPKDFPHQNGRMSHPYSKSLVIIRYGAMRENSIGDGSQVMFQAISVDAYGRWLNGAPGHLSIFDRYGFVEDDGSTINRKSHDFRHWLNDIAHRTGMSSMDIAMWSGRDPSENKHYDHETPDQLRLKLLTLIDKSGGIGPIFEAADSIEAPTLINREQFLRSHIGSAHHTDLGACIHDYSLLPCQKYGDCKDCCELVFIKGDPDNKNNAQTMYDLALRQIETATLSMDQGECGADIWLRDHQKSLRRLGRILQIHNDSSIPDGTVINLPAEGSDSGAALPMRDQNPIKRGRNPNA